MNRSYILVFLLAVGYGTIGFSQQTMTVTPLPDEAKHAVTFDMGGNTPTIGVSYHNHIIRFANAHQPYTRALELSAGLGFSPKTWLLRLYIMGMIYQEKGTAITSSGDLVWQKKTYLKPSPGLSIGKRF